MLRRRPNWCPFHGRAQRERCTVTDETPPDPPPLLFLNACRSGAPGHSGSPVWSQDAQAIIGLIKSEAFEKWSKEYHREQVEPQQVLTDYVTDTFAPSAEAVRQSVKKALEDTDNIVIFHFACHGIFKHAEEPSPEDESCKCLCENPKSL
ncbi:MAG: hypothetical protein JWO38_4519 [Gemmataceae bacterium]|nr:hypothetical protein [Gemmataceae bacterium]